MKTKWAYGRSDYCADDKHGRSDRRGNKIATAPSKAGYRSSAPYDSVEEVDHFVSHVNVTLQMAVKVLHAFFRDEMFVDVIARHVLPQTGEADGFAPFGLALFREEIIDVDLQGIGMRRV